jgi:outer membrane protein TolC
MAKFVRLSSLIALVSVGFVGPLNAEPPAPSPGVPVADGSKAAASSSAPAPSAPAAISSTLPRVGLRQALKEALARELRVRIAISEVTRARALIRNARASFLPSLYGHGSYVRLDHQRGPDGPGLIAGRDQLAADLTLNVPIFAPRGWYDTGQASDNARIAEFDLADARRQVALATAQAYLSILTQRRVIEVNQRALENANAHYQFTHARLEGGLGNQVDDVRAAQEVSTSAAQLENGQAGVYAAQEALGVLLGRRAPVDVVDQLDLPSAPSLAQGLDEAATGRSDVRADIESVQAQKRVIDHDWTEYAPLLAAVAQPFYNHPSTLAVPKTGWQIELLLTLPFYDGGAREGTIAQREATLTERRDTLDATLRQAKSEVRVAFDAVRHADAALGSSKQSAQFAAQALQFANVAYEAGASTNIEVVDAERRARDADTAVVIAEDVSRQARLDLLAASGRFP